MNIIFTSTDNFKYIVTREDSFACLLNIVL